MYRFPPHVWKMFFPTLRFGSASDSHPIWLVPAKYVAYISWKVFFWTKLPLVKIESIKFGLLITLWTLGLLYLLGSELATYIYLSNAHSFTHKAFLYKQNTLQVKSSKPKWEEKPIFGHQSQSFKWKTAMFFASFGKKIFSSDYPVRKYSTQMGKKKCQCNPEA